MDLLVPYISTAHALGMKVKLYYTMRELSTRLPELWAFRSLGNEIYRSEERRGKAIRSWISGCRNISGTITPPGGSPSPMRA